MEKAETLEEFYRRQRRCMPAGLRPDAGHFNLFRLEPLVAGMPVVVPYRRRDFFKVLLVKGHSKVWYADRVTEVKRQALTFSNPFIPYQWEHLDQVREGCYCIFDRYFFHQYGQMTRYAVFQPQGQHVFELSDAEFATVQEIFERMFGELASDYIHKYDVLRNHVSELLHYAMKRQPATVSEKRPEQAAQRICQLFLELLERQFPIGEGHPRIGLRGASDFAAQLNIHTNHLNRAVRSVTGQTTSRLIAGRVLQEAKALLIHSRMNISEIAFALGFSEATHFNHFFRKGTGTSPGSFRQGGDIDSGTGRT